MEAWSAGAEAKLVDIPEDYISRQHVLQSILDIDKSGVDITRSGDLISVHKPGMRVGLAWAAAAAVLVLIIAGYYFIRQPQKMVIPAIAQTKLNDIAPGTNKAVLTLGNGSKIILESAHNGVLAREGNTHIIKTDSGKLAYSESKDQPAAISFNTLTTPRGGDFQLTLSDGTKVWLNAASSITYPTAFAGGERSVNVTGEAYFEVATDKTKPFTVNVGEMRVAVLGTHFNINSYSDESAIKTTLLEGSVKISIQKTNQSETISPGQQTQFIADKLSVNNRVDVDEIIAWKEGTFDFESADLKTILRQFSRWYDVEVVYEGPVTDKRFFAVVSRNTSLKKCWNCFRIITLNTK